MTLTRKHFKDIAIILAKTEARNIQVSAFINYFESENPNFKKDLFVKAIENELIKIRKVNKQMQESINKGDIAIVNDPIELHNLLGGK